MFSFGQPIVLFALAGLALPFIIHRISRSRPTEWKFSSILLLRETPLPNSGNKKLSDILLLILRLLFLLFLTLGLAGLQFNRAETSTISSTGESIFVVDYSASINGWNAKEEMIESIKGIIDDLPSNEAIGFVVFANEPFFFSNPEANNTARLLDFLDDNEPRLASGSPRTALELANELSSKDRTTSVHIISDFQETNWNAEMPEFDTSTQLKLHKVGADERNENLAVMDARATTAGPGEIHVISEIENFGAEEKKAELIVTTSDETMRQIVSVPANSRSVFSIKTKLPSNPEATVKLLSEEDPFKEDNEWHIWAGPPPPMYVLSVMTESASDEAYEEAFFLNTALSAASDHEWIEFNGVSTGLQSINATSLKRTSAVFLPAEIASEGKLPLHVLKPYVEAGGLLILTLDRQAVRTIEGFNEAGILNLRYTGRQGRQLDSRNYYHIGDIPDTSPLQEVFQGNAAKDLNLVSIVEYAKINTLKQHSEVLLVSEEGHPLILKQSLGKGNVLVITFPLNRAASDLPLRASYLPIVRELLKFSSNSYSDISNISTWESSAVSENSRLKEWNTPGAFIHNGYPVVINLSRSESELAQLSTKRLLNNLSQRNSPTENFSNSGNSSNTISLGPWLLLLTSLIWLIEFSVCVLKTRHLPSN